MSTILKIHPAVVILSLVEKHNLYLSVDRGECRIFPMEFYIKSFPGDKHEYIRSFTIGFEDDSGVWAVGKGACITAEKKKRKIAIGASLGDKITIENVEYVIEADYNHNIKFTKVVIQESRLYDDVFLGNTEFQDCEE